MPVHSMECYDVQLQKTVPLDDLAMYDPIKYFGVPFRSYYSQ